MTVRGQKDKDCVSSVYHLYPELVLFSLLCRWDVPESIFCSQFSGGERNVVYAALSTESECCVR